jgi:hypothetical protein
MSNLQEIFDEALRLALNEETERSYRDVIVTKGAIGSGRFGFGVGEGRERAQLNPQGLMKDLGVSAPKGDTDLEKAASLIAQAVSNNSAMKEAFDRPRSSKRSIVFSSGKGGKMKYKQKVVPCVVVPIKNNVIEYRNAVYFIQAVLVGAYNAGMLQLSPDTRIKFLAEQSGAKIPTFYEEKIS